MADFRKWIIALSAVALLLSLSAPLANAQAFTCTGNAGAPVIVRAEGRTELVGDIILNCTGGTPTAVAAPIPQSNITLFLNGTNLTSRLYAGNLSEAVLTMDEPFPAAPNPAQAPPAGAATTQLGCTAINAVNCAMVGTGGGIGAAGPYSGVGAGNFNVFQGIQIADNSVAFNGVPIDPPGAGITRVVRITNIRADASQLGLSANPLFTTQLTATVGVNGSQQLTLQNPTQLVALIVPGLVATNTKKTFVQCININADLIDAANDPGQIGAVTITATEGFAASFKPRTFAQYAGTNAAPISPAVAAPLDQNILGFPYNSESGFVATVGNLVTSGTTNGSIGLADTGTQIKIGVSAIGDGIKIYVPTTVWLYNISQPIVACPVALCNATGVAVLSGAAFDGTGTVMSSLTISGGTASAVYEVWLSNPAVVEGASIPVFVAAVSDTAHNKPGIGTSQGVISFNPLSDVNKASTTAPIPRFTTNAVPKDIFTINTCTCNLLFPFVSDQNGFDTGVAIANTTVDPFGTPPQHGTVILNYYPSDPTTTAPAAQTSTDVAAGAELLFTLSGGGDHGITAVPDFTGYIIAQANFQYCHAFAFISDFGAQKLAEGYLALQLDEGGLPRTNVPGESKSH